MSKLIQMIPTEDGQSVFLIAFDKETNILTYRTAEERLKEVVEVSNGMLKTSTYWFPKEYLDKLLKTAG